MSDPVSQLGTSMRSKLVSLGDYDPSVYCIHKVPERIRKLKKECYLPSVVSIGPIYYRHQSLEAMEDEAMQDMKWRHLQCFLRESSYSNVQHYIDIIREQEDEARRCYDFQIKLSSDEFVEMVLLDAAFIIYFFMSTSDEFMLDRRPMEHKQELIPFIERDLFLQENQLPFFVLRKLYHEAFGTTYSQLSFAYLASGFISRSRVPGNEGANKTVGNNIPNVSNIRHSVGLLRQHCCIPSERGGERPSNSDPEAAISTAAIGNISEASNIKHLVDFLRLCCLPSKPRDSQLISSNEDPEFPMSASQLKAAGVKFRASNGKNLLDISFSKGVLEIPKFVVQDSTESIFRSIMFYEQCHHYGDSYFIDYMAFLDDLINTAEDVRILVKSGIIENWLGDEESEVHLFNSITKQININISNFYYSGICRDLKTHAYTPCHRWLSILRRDYFNHPWAAASVVYAIVLLVLSVLQVYTGYKSI